MLPTPPPLLIPKYHPHYNSPPESRPRILQRSSFVSDIPRIVSSAISPVHSDSPPDSVDDDHLPSPHSPVGSSANYHYANRGSASFSSPISPTEMYDQIPSAAHFPNASHSFQSSSAPQDSYALSSQSHHQSLPLPGARSSDALTSSYISDTPSPIDVQPPPYPHSVSSAHTHERFPHPSPSTFPPEGDRFHQPSDSLHDRYSRSTIINKYPGNPSHPQNLLDRRMSEPVLSTTGQYTSNPSPAVAGRYFDSGVSYGPPPRTVPPYVSSLQRGVSIGSLRDLRQQQLHYPAQAAIRHQQLESYTSGVGDDSLSPFQTNFSGGVLNSTTSAGLQYSPIAENPYEASPPGTANSTSNNAPVSNSLRQGQPQIAPQSHLQPRLSQLPQQPTSPQGGADTNNSKTYSFVALPGNAVKKRPRRRYDEIERLYQCSWPECTKAYGTLNHLNAHVTMQKHGQKRSPNEFKELRKQWRKAKKEAEAASQLTGAIRRNSLTMRPDDRDIYDSQRYGPGQVTTPSTQRLQSASHVPLNIPSSVPITNTGSDGRYPVVEDHQYPLSDRVDSIEYGIAGKSTYSNETSASWSTVMPTSPSRSNFSQQYMAVSVPNLSSSQGNQLQVGMTAALAQQQPHELSQTSSTANIPISGRLPPDSTLLTPLPGYSTSSIMPSMQDSAPDLSYPPEGYEFYGDHTQRPGTGHHAVNRGNGDEFERRG
ncbi:hypothetical protein AX16_001774 [Volvariella volvacea WC 439]|nr:hypothetical protein AX16_001774 [Volvariella volvacea WC 439]